MSSGMILTNAGRDLIAKALTGKVLTFTRAQCGDGQLPVGIDVRTFTELISPKRDLPIQSMRTSSTGTAEVVVEMSNKDLKTGFFVYEYGLFAQDPDTQDEILYSYAYNTNAGYLEGDNGVDLINYTLSLVTVIDQAPNIQAKIESSNQYVTITRLNATIQDMFAPFSSINGFWTFAKNDTQRFRPATVQQAREALIGTYDVNRLSARLDRLEDNVAEILLSLEMMSSYPGYTHYLIEDFKNVNQIDRFKSKVTSIITGDDSIDVEPLDGMLPGSWYTISDGIYSERVQVGSINIENGIQRVILTDTIKNTYTLSNTYIMRSSTEIQTGSARSAGSSGVLTWSPGIAWRGISDKAVVSVTWGASTMEMKEDALMDSSGYITLSE